MTSMPPTTRTKLWRGLWMIASLTGIVGLVAWLIIPHHPQAQAGMRPASSKNVVASVRVEPDGTIVIAESSPLRQHLSELTLASKQVRFATLTVSGSILARIHVGSEPIEDRWRFSNPALGTAYADWLRTSGEIEFNRSQLTKTRELAAVQTEFLEANLQRLEPLIKSGSVPERDFKAAQAELLKAQLQGEKDIFSAQSTLRTALKAKTALERELSQDGIEPVVFSRAIEHMVLIAANVPEGRIAQVHEGQGCLARFYAFPDRTFDAHVETLSSLLTSERRTLRVLFELSDPDELLRPGMFAEVGLGTDDRDAILIPGESLLHVNLKDYVLVAAGTGLWKPTVVRVGDQHEGAFEVLEGLQAGQTIISRGAILLKPSVTQALRLEESESAP